MGTARRLGTEPLLRPSAPLQIGHSAVRNVHLCHARQRRTTVARSAQPGTLQPGFLASGSGSPWHLYGTAPADSDALRPARGIATALVVGLVLWAVISGLGWVAVR